MFGKLIGNAPPAAETAVTIPAAPAWDERLQAALGDDSALLAFAQEAPTIELKLAAVQALSAEDALRHAEREFRTHDRRVHSAAKLRYETRVKQRKMRAQADELVQAAVALAAEPAILANRLVELDRAWHALDAGLLEEAQMTRFAHARASLAELVRERGDRQRTVARWAADARQALAAVEACRSMAAGAAPDGDKLAAAGAAVSAALAAVPSPAPLTKVDTDAIAALEPALQAALAEAAAIGARLEEDEARVQEQLRKKRDADERKLAGDKDKAARQARSQPLKDAAQAAEEALAAGQLAQAGKHLAALQSAAERSNADAAMQARIDRLQAEVARLKDWQRWGGGRAREDLVEEAEALARSTVAAKLPLKQLPEARHWHPLPCRSTAAVKLPLKQLEKTIEQLHARWKELDRLGGATGKAIWQRFDAALKTAYLPVAAHMERLKEARRQNLAARERLLAALDALSIGGEGQGQAPDWKEIGRALADFQAEWRKLGPVEHAVAHKKQAALLKRMKAGVARLEEPLREARRNAQAERAQLVERAKALVETAQDRDTVDKIRALQAEWQRHAKSHPLLRKTENALWADFKAAIDAVMKRRQEAFHARQAGFETHRAAREAVIARIEALCADTPAAEIKRALAAAETEWRQAGEAPRERAAALESRFRRARETALRHVAGSALKKWHGTCGTLVAKLALCEELEAAAGAPQDAEFEARWSALPTLPFGWEEALQARFKAGASDGDTGKALDDLLLQLEAALDMPSPPAYQAARRSLKLLAMKNALEERRATAPSDAKTLAAAAFACRRTNPEQRERLAAVVAALRAAEPAGFKNPSR